MSDAQSKDFESLVKEHGLDPGRISSVEDALKDLNSANRKIRSQQKDLKGLVQRVEALEGIKQNSDLEDEYPDEGTRNVVKELRGMQQQMGTLKRELWLSKHPNYEKVKDIMDDLLDNSPELQHVSDPEARMELAYRLAGGYEADKTSEVRRAAMARATRESPSGPTTEPGSHTHSSGREAVAKLKAEMKEALAEAKTKEERKAIADKFNEKETKIRDEYEYYEFPTSGQ
ncbi:MAG: hypothetical protein GF388_01055 [Candidatus Aegiribacteria sp.]|nr:hypothetical protein [Candidatus Aegiribacteria sp.]